MAISDPRDISGLVFWGSAEYEAANYTDGQQMNGGLTDLSGNANHATRQGGSGPWWDASTGPGSGPAIDFMPGWFALPTGLVSGWTEGEVYYILKPTTTAVGLHVFGEDGGGGDGTFWNTDPQQETFGAATGQGVDFTPNPVIGTSAFRTYNVSRSSDTLSNWIDGTLNANAVSSTTLFRTGVPYFGVNSVNGGLSWNYQGFMTLVLVYDRALTSGERGDLDTWAAANPNGGDIAGPTIVTPGAISAVAAVPAPTVTAPSNATVTPSVIATVASVPAAAAETGSPANVVAPGVAVTTTIPAPTVTTTIVISTVVPDESVSGRRLREGFGLVTALPATGQRIGPIKKRSLVMPTPTIVDGRPT